MEYSEHSRQAAELNGVIDALEQGLRDVSGNQAMRGLMLRAVKTLMTRMLAREQQIEPVKFVPYTDDAFLVELTRDITIPGMLDKSTALAIRQLGGQAKLLEFLDGHGGVLSPADTAKLLGITPDAVRKRKIARKLIGLKLGKATVYPAFQFQDGQVVPHLGQVLQALPPESPVAQIRFLLTWDDDLQMTPLDALRQGSALELVLRKARQEGEQVAR